MLALPAPLMDERWRMSIDSKAIDGATVKTIDYHIPIPYFEYMHGMMN